MGLQRTVGNRAVLGAIAEQPHAVQRDGAPGVPIGAETALDRAQQIRAAATVRLGKVAAFNSRADAAIGAYRSMRTGYASSWGAAWDRHSSKLAEGNAEAASQNFIEGIVVGTAAAVLITAAAAVAFPAAAAAAPFTALWWAFNVGSNTVSSVAGSTASGAVGRPSVPAASGGSRDAEADAWQRIAEVERVARAVVAVAPKFGLELGNAEYCIAQVRSHIDQGSGDMSWDQTLDMVSTLTNWEAGLTAFDAEIDARIDAIGRFGQLATEFHVPSVSDLEKEIWRSWMSTLDNSSDEVLDQDVIQKYLVRLGLIPDYFYMTDDDQHRAVAEARAHVSQASRPPD
ncbi:hypothetical protein [Amycolatopsis sp. CA-126428]|uniref:hypothetical protein n=1 Tax=Amycolatopsis sp. CA-126428 TaxID=2073158 RepID=UPI0011B0C621|nr:hypothetical protein [Amycolatopsis sp. CA-126428]